MTKYGRARMTPCARDNRFARRLGGIAQGRCSNARALGCIQRRSHAEPGRQLPLRESVQPGEHEGIDRHAGHQRERQQPDA